MHTNDSEASEFLDRLAAFLVKNGHRGLKELELRSPRWEEKPEPVLGMIRNYMLVEKDPLDHETAVGGVRLELEKRIKKGLEIFPLEKSTRLRWRILRHLAGLTKYFARMRENSRFYHIMGFYVIRKKVRRIEKDFIDQGKLKCMDDIFFLHLKEIEEMRKGRLDWEDVEERIRKRRMEHIRLSKTIPPKFIGIKTKQLVRPERKKDEADILLQGQPASPGTYEGIARIILDPSVDVELKPGEVLVAPYTDPAWTPLFLTAGAAVVEVGSYLSHAGTVAREFGMPCVVDLPSCTANIQTGANVCVDGDRGTVTVLDERKNYGDPS
jgi:phosphohistidine swiveling domain-containing protein